MAQRGLLCQFINIYADNLFFSYVWIIWKSNSNKKTREEIQKDTRGIVHSFTYK